MFLPHFDIFCDLLLNTADARLHGVICSFVITKQTTTEKAFLFKVFQHNSKAGLCPLPLLSIQNVAISVVIMGRKLKLESSVAYRGMKTYSKSRIELRNLQILKKMLSQVIFCHQSSPVSRKAWMLP